MSTSSEATTLPLRDDALSGAWARLRARLARTLPSGALARAGARVHAGGVALAAIVIVSVLVVLMAAERPSLLSPTSHTNYFPHWMAGPLGGLWPGLTDNGTTLKYLFTGAIVLMYAGYLVAFVHASRLRVRWIVASILAVHAIFLLSPPLALTDIFNYINYGRMEVVHHLNPYTSIPISEPHSDPSFALSNWHQLLSPYGPLFTLLTFVVVPLGVAGSFWVLKALLAAASLATIYLVWRCAQLLGRDPRRAAVLVGLNPIVLVWGLGGDHNDFLILLCIVLGVYLILRARSVRLARGERPAGGARSGAAGLLLPLSASEIAAGAAFVLAAGLKASAAVLIPVVLVAVARTPRRLVQVLLGMVAAGVLVGALSLAAFGLHIPDLSTQSRLVTSESVPNLIGLAVGAGGEDTTVRAVMTALLALSLLAACWIAWRRHDLATACGWASVALLVTLSWVLPWYVLWILPLAAISASRRLRVTALVLGAYLIVAWAPASGQLWNAIGFHPEKTSLGRLHQRYVRELLN